MHKKAPSKWFILLFSGTPAKTVLLGIRIQGQTTVKPVPTTCMVSQLGPTVNEKSHTLNIYGYTDINGKNNKIFMHA